ncbi:unnamed protein product [Linum tenue]|uniref:TF-B3 domain-containing protein n=1 Tax=Linum tenue TaxID=586396 RepID=A0AAV0IPC6_9ROSI|nr:unnamed protein product [Linum tenue]
MAGGAHSLRRTAKRPQFFRLIMPGMVRDQQLAVPKLFAKKYGAGLSKRVVFELPNGTEWPIRLSGGGDKLWFGQGWRQFADFHCVNSMGFLLMFEYLGDSRFRVFIFDPSASEISYPPPSEADVSGESGGQEDDPSVEILDGYSSSPETREDPPPLSNRPRPPKLKKGLARGSNWETTLDEDLSSESSQDDVEVCPARKVNRVIGRPKPFSGSGSSAGGNGGVWRRTVSAVLPGKAVSRTDMQSSKLKTNRGRQSTVFTSGNGSFEVTVAPGHLPRSRNCKVRIPTGFASNVEKDVREAELWVEGSYWPVTFNREVQKGKDYTSLCGGWRLFAEENFLEEGDVCVFKLIGTKDDGFSKSMKFKVNISRGE